MSRLEQQNIIKLTEPVKVSQSLSVSSIRPAARTETTNPVLTTNKTARVISNKIQPCKYNPVPACKDQDSLYVVNMNDRLGFTAQRIQADIDKQERLNQIHRAWNMQALRELWSSMISHPLPEEAIFLEFGLIIVCRKIEIGTASTSREIWDITVWEVNQGQIQAIHQFISKQEPEPRLLSEGTNGQRVFMLNEDQGITVDPDSGHVELIKVQNHSLLKMVA